jgi:hypothetical protein
LIVIKIGAHFSSTAFQTTVHGSGEADFLQTSNHSVVAYLFTFLFNSGNLTTRQPDNNDNNSELLTAAAYFFPMI